MTAPKFFKTEFDRLAINGAIGHPQGELAYGYLRVSASYQADENQTGLPRQIKHIHEAALNNGLKIPWELIFADDDSGFEFANRPELSRLRQEYRSHERRANAVVIEHLDRLSRNADWHQGYLLDEMKKNGIRPVFWKPFSSRVERAVLGAIAQDGMEQMKQRMAEGTLHKARTGRITAKVPAYGYKLVDSYGNEGPTAKKDTHYAIREDEAQVVRFIYNKVIEGHTLGQVSVMLDKRITPPGRFAHWELKMLQILVRNPVYKGEFAANRSHQIKLTREGNPDSLTEGSTRTVLRKIQRPREEWIVIPVPAIVSPEIWEQANQMINKPAITPKHTYLLTGLLQCATCNYSFGGAAKRYMKSQYRNGPKFENWRFFYRCSSRRGRIPAIREAIGCNQLTISMRVLDEAVWSGVYEVLLRPDILLSALEREFRNEQNEQLRQQIIFLEEQIREAAGEDAKLYRAYLAGAFDEVEYAEQRKALKDGSQNAASEIARLNSLLMTPEQYDERKREIMLICQNATASGLTLDAPFEVKKRIIHTIIDRIILNVNEGWFELNGIFSGRYHLPTNDDIESQDNEDDSGTNRGGHIVCNPKRLAECFSGLRRWVV